MPTPNMNETKDEYIARCIPVVLEDGTAKDNDQAVAVCNSMWEQGQEKMKVETTDMTGQEICYAGVFGDKKSEDPRKRKEITEKMIDQMIENFNAGIVSPYLNLDHDDEFTEKVKDALKISRLGTVSKLYKIGNKLVADFKNVPKKVAELIKDGTIGQRSLEMYRTIKRADKTWNNVLSAVSFFGKDLPAVPGLQEALPSLYSSDDEEPIKIKLEQTKQELPMSNQETVSISKVEYDALMKSKGDLEKFTAEKENADLVTLKSEVDRLKPFEAEVVKLKAENEAMKNEKEASAEAALETEVTAFCEKYKDRIPPAHIEDYKTDYKNWSKNDPERLERFKKEMEDRKQTLFDNMTYPEGEGAANKKVNFNSDSEDANMGLDQIEQAIQYKMKSKGLNWADARKEVFAENGKEV